MRCQNIIKSVLSKCRYSSRKTSLQSYLDIVVTFFSQAIEPIVIVCDEHGHFKLQGPVMNKDFAVFHSELTPVSFTYHALHLDWNGTQSVSSLILANHSLGREQWLFLTNQH